MSKKGMKRMERTHIRPENEVSPVPEIQGKAKHTDKKANPIIAGTSSPSLKVYHTTPFETEKPISPIYSEIDNDLARDNLENDVTAADLEEL